MAEGHTEGTSYQELPHPPTEILVAPLSVEIPTGCKLLQHQCSFTQMQCCLRVDKQVVCYRYSTIENWASSNHNSAISEYLLNSELIFAILYSAVDYQQGSCCIHSHELVLLLMSGGL